MNNDRSNGYEAAAFEFAAACVILLLMAGCLYLWAATVVEMHFHRCGASFRLDSAEWACRQPAILVYAAIFAFVGSVIAFGVALFLRFRKKRKS